MIELILSNYQLVSNASNVSTIHILRYVLLILEQQDVYSKASIYNLQCLNPILIYPDYQLVLFTPIMLILTPIRDNHT